MTYAPEHFTVWAEIPVTDMEKSMAFYIAVTDAALEEDSTGPNPVVMFRPNDPKTGVALHLYPGKPAGDGSGPTIHLAIPGTAEEAMARVEKAGGKVVSPVIDIPPGRFFYGLDLDGNSIGLFESR